MFTERLQNRLVITTKNTALKTILNGFYTSATTPSNQKPQIFEALRPIGEFDINKALELWGTPKQAELNVDDQNVASHISLDEKDGQVHFDVCFDTDRCPPNALLSHIYQSYPQTEIKNSWYCDDDGAFSSFTNGFEDASKSIFEMDMSDPCFIPSLIMLENTFDLDVEELLNIISDVSENPLTDEEIEDTLNTFNIAKNNP